jgi:hypothetical protein
VLFPWGMLFDSGLPRAWWGPRATTTTSPPPPRLQLFRENIFPDVFVVIAFQRLYLNFSYQISVLCLKKQISCPLSRNISPKKMTVAQQNPPPPQNTPEMAFDYCLNILIQAPSAVVTAQTD